MAPFFARRLASRERAAHRHEGREPLPPEVLLDRSASILLAVAAIGLTVAGLGNRPVIVSETKATEDNAKLVERYVNAHGTPEVKENLQTANSKRLAEGYFRTCINLNDRSRAFCMFVNTKTNTVVKDGDSRPNAVSLGGGFYAGGGCHLGGCLSRPPACAGGSSWIGNAPRRQPRSVLVVSSETVFPPIGF